MDRDWGAKTGGGGVASGTNSNVDRRERLRKLALETIDLAKDPYFMRNHLGSYDCRLCLTMHTNEGNYLAHTQGKRHQSNLAKRHAKDAKENPSAPSMIGGGIKSKGKPLMKNVTKIGRPGYRVTKQRDLDTDQLSLLFQIEFPEIDANVIPRHRFMSSFEQRVEVPDRAYQYLLFAAEPYETVAFKVPNYEVDRTPSTEKENKIFSHWDPIKHIYTLQVYFKQPDTSPPPTTVIPNSSVDLSSTVPPPAQAAAGHVQKSAKPS